MKRSSYIISLFLLMFISNGSAQFIKTRLTSSFYLWERYDTVDVSKTYLRASQNVQFEISQGNLSFQTSFTGMSNLINTFGSDAVVRFSNMFVKYKKIANVMDFSLGRVPYFAGVGIGVVDGALLKTNLLNNKIAVTGYGGINVPSTLMTFGLASSDRNFVIGGQVVGHFNESVKIGVSYVNRRVQLHDYWTVRPDSLFNPELVRVEPDSRADQLVGLDVRYDLRDKFTTYYRYDVDLNRKQTIKGQFSGRYYLTPYITFTGEFIYREPHIPYYSYLTVFKSFPIREYEGGVEYSFSDIVRTYAKFAYVGYSDASNRRLTIGINTENISLSYSGSSGYAGQLSYFNVQGMYPMYERKFIPNAGISFATYRLQDGSHKRDEIFGATLGSIIRIVSSVSADVQIHWIKNKTYNNDLRGIVKFSYWFSKSLNLFSNEETIQ